MLRTRVEFRLRDQGLSEVRSVPGLPPRKSCAEPGGDEAANRSGQVAGSGRNCCGTWLTCFKTTGEMKRDRSPGRIPARSTAQRLREAGRAEAPA